MARGAQLEREIRVAMAAEDVPSISELCRRSSIQRDTMYAWFRGDHPPKPDTLKKVADTLNVRVGDLWDYEEARPEEDEASLLRDLVAELRAWRTEDRVRIAALERFAEGADALRQAGSTRSEVAESRAQPAPRKTTE